MVQWLSSILGEYHQSSSILLAKSAVDRCSTVGLQPYSFWWWHGCWTAWGAVWVDGWRGTGTPKCIKMRCAFLLWRKSSTIFFKKQHTRQKPGQEQPVFPLQDLPSVILGGCLPMSAIGSDLPSPWLQGPSWYQVMTHAEVTEARSFDAKMWQIRRVKDAKMWRVASWNNIFSIMKLWYQSVAPILWSCDLKWFEDSWTFVEPPPTWQESKSQACSLHVKALVSNKNAEGRLCQ